MGILQCHNVMEFRDLARRRLPKPFYDFLEGAADDGYTARRNIAAFDELELVPDYLVNVGSIDTRVELLGAKLDWPVFLSPTGASRMFHHDGELAAARAAARAGTLYSLSTVSTHGLEDVAKATVGPKMFQLYTFRDPGFTRELVDRAKAAGYTALCLTVDVPVLGNRELDLKHGMGTPPRLQPSAYFNIALHPRWLLGFLRQPRFEFVNYTTARQSDTGGGRPDAILPPGMDPTMNWERAAAVAKQWNGPFAIKGILSVRDAVRAADIGATAVMVSNHGGRQMDGVPAPMDVLEDIAGQVGDRLEIILDGGIRRGTSVIKALARGARACSIGRPYLYGLAAGGEAGVTRVLKILRSEILRGMALTGRTSLSQLGPSLLRPSGQRIS